jgi:hypothetical protein
VNRHIAPLVTSAIHSSFHQSFSPGSKPRIDFITQTVDLALDAISKRATQLTLTNSASIGGLRTNNFIQAKSTSRPLRQK